MYIAGFIFGGRFKGLNRMCFQPYDHDEISSIIKDRLCGSAAVEEDAVELASRKVSVTFSAYFLLLR